MSTADKGTRTLSSSNLIMINQAALIILTVFSVIMNLITSVQATDPPSVRLSDLSIGLPSGSLLSLGQLTTSSQHQDSLPTCNFTSDPKSGCPSDQMACNKHSQRCVCKEDTPVFLANHCFASLDINSFCLSSVLCAKARAKCYDATGKEVDIFALRSSTEQPSSTPSSVSKTVDPDIAFLLSSSKIMGGLCKCPEGHYYDINSRICQDRILDSKCFFTTDCFLKSHATSQAGRCRCKDGFFHDHLSDQCRPNVVTTLCLYGNTYDKVTQKCLPGGLRSHGDGGGLTFHTTDSGVSALFWPAVAFFLVIFLLRLLKEGMKRDCDRLNERRVIRRRGQRVLRPRGPYPGLAFGTSAQAGLPGHSSSGLPSSSASRSEVIVLMPSGLPPPYSAHGSDHVYAGTVDEPPSYEEATRPDIQPVSPVVDK